MIYVRFTIAKQHRLRLVRMSCHPTSCLLLNDRGLRKLYGLYSWEMFRCESKRGVKVKDEDDALTEGRGGGNERNVTTFAYRQAAF
jgi:hypothetical protein